MNEASAVSIGSIHAVSEASPFEKRPAYYLCFRLPLDGLNWSWEPLHADHWDNSPKGLAMWSSLPPFFLLRFASIAFVFGLQLALLTVNDFA